MSNIIGMLRTQLLYPVSSGYSTPILDSRIRIPNFSAPDVGVVNRGGALTKYQPVLTPSKNRNGGRAYSFQQDYYHRTHVNPLKVNVGNLLSSQVKSIEVWNAHFATNTLNSIVEEATGGLVLSGVANPPLSYQSLQSKVYTLNVSINGPATIDAKFLFNFSLDALSAYIPKLSVLGLRILAWWPRPNWDTPIIERWEWLTNVITSKNKKEQRIKLRDKPRRQFEYNTLIQNNKERQLVENLLFSWQSRVFGLPVWTDQQLSTYNIQAGSLILNCDTFSRDFKDGGLFGIFDDTNFEIGTITKVNVDSLELESPLLYNWPIRTKIVPMRTARLSDKQPMTRHSDSITSMTVQFRLEEGDNRAPLVETIQYRNYSVLEVKPNWKEELSSEFLRDIKLLDYLTGKVLSDDLSDTSTATHRYNWLATTRTEVNTLRAFLFARFGKLVPIWVPSFLTDMVPVEVIGAGSSLLVVEHTTYVRNIAQAVQRRDLRIKLYNGTIFYKRILSSAEDGNKERLVLDTAFPDIIYPEQIEQISFLTLCRLDADSVEAKWETDSIMEISTLIRTIRDDV